MAKKPVDVTSKLTCPKCKKSFSSLTYLREHYCPGVPINKLPPYKPKGK